MSVTVISVLQIGDIHYPQLKDLPSSIDHKDLGISPNIVEAVSLPPLQSLIRTLQRVFGKDSIDCLALMGDLTTVGDREGYKACLEFLCDRLIEGRWLKSQRDKIVIVPGNHDVNRKDIKKEDVYQKFEPLRTVVAEMGFNNFPVKKEKHLNLTNAAGAALSIYALNSCLGCGEQRYLPKAVRQAVVNALRKKLQRVKHDEKRYKKELHYITEELDCPVIEASVINDLHSSIMSLPPNSAALICAHHNFLPQVTPRVDIYTELMNGGMFRKSLLETNRPVVFLHGHIHKDPIDILHDPNEQKSILVSIAAPLFQRGFNVIRIAYSSDNVPLGCEVKKYRHSDSNNVVIEGIVPIPFWRHPQVAAVIGETARNILRSTEHDKYYFLSDLNVSFLHGENEGIKEEDIRDAIIEMRWLNLMKIENEEGPNKNWRISRVP